MGGRKVVDRERLGGRGRVSETEGEIEADTSDSPASPTDITLTRSKRGQRGELHGGRGFLTAPGPLAAQAA